MNIAYVTADAEVPVFGCRPSSVHVQETLRALLRRRDQLDVFAAAFGGPLSAEFSALKMRSIAPTQAHTPADCERAALNVNEALRQQLSAQHADQPFSLVYERYSLWGSTGMDFAREQHIPGILEVNSPVLEEVTRRHLLI